MCYTFTWGIQINTTIEKEIECTENIESNTELKLLKL